MFNSTGLFYCHKKTPPPSHPPHHYNLIRADHIWKHMTLFMFTVMVECSCLRMCMGYVYDVVYMWDHHQSPIDFSLWLYTRLCG